MQGTKGTTKKMDNENLMKDRISELGVQESVACKGRWW